MAFYWKGNSLFTRKGTVPEEMAGRDTFFILDYRSTSSPVPSLVSLCRFLSQSLTFVGLEDIELWLDDWTLFSLRKKSTPTSDVPIPRELDTKSRQGMMRISNIESQGAQIDASWMNVVGWIPTAVEKGAVQPSDGVLKQNQAPSLRGFFSKLTSTSQSTAAKKALREEEASQQAIAEDIAGTSRATVFLRVNTVHIKNQVSSSFALELERATKKSPPKHTKISILTSSHDETQASMSTLSGVASGKVSEVITSILPSKNGRVFIGFPTAQTTGLLAHISAPSLIPTVERESIDLNARHVKTWNEELLYIAGISCRIAYSVGMLSIRTELSAYADSKGGRIGETELDKVIPGAIHVFNQFSFRESTPLARAGQIIEESFWGCDRKFSIDILSSRGVLPSEEVRIASENLSFVERIPVVPDKLVTQAVEFMTRLQEFGLVSEITLADIKKELERQAISSAQLEEFMKWCVKKTRTGQVDASVLQSLFSVTVAQLDPKNGEQQGRLLALTDVKSFVNRSKMSPELPFPPHTIPFRFTKGLDIPHLKSLGWEELQIVPWLRWLMQEATSRQPSIPAHLNPTMHPLFAAQILATISKGYDNLSESSRASVVQALADQTVIPTRLGLRKPPDSYFPSVRLFEDLAIINNMNAVKERFLKALGVRKTIELSVIFERLMGDRTNVANAGKPTWSHVDLIRYLVSVWSDIPEQDILLLQNTPLCPAEKEDNRNEPTDQRYKVANLYEPKEDLRGLGLPVLQWPEPLFPYSPDGKFLKLLGLRAFPSSLEIVDVLVRANQRGDMSIYEAGLRYFISNYTQNIYVDFKNFAGVQAFLPVQDREKGPLAQPEEVFSEPQASALGYQILRNDLQSHASKFGVLQNPYIDDCALRLIRNPPQDKTEAKKIFGYLASRLQDVNSRVAERLGNAAIVPVLVSSPSSSTEKAPRYRLATPVSCFLGGGEEYGEIFDYVDFGHQSNSFLLKVGSKHEPSSLELTRLVVREPARIFQILGVEKYLSLLTKIQVNKSTLKKDKSLWTEMKRLPFLLAYHERLTNVKKQKPKLAQPLDGEDDDADDTVKEWHLRCADQIVIVDDLICYSLFKQYLLAAPQEEALEELYYTLGSPTVSSQVKEEPRLGPRKGDQRKAEELRQRIVERTQLFLHEQPAATVRHNTKWLEKNLEVQEVQSASLRRVLQGHNLSNSEKRTATLTEDSHGKPILSITSDYDVWQVSQAIVSITIDRGRTQTIMIFEMFLTTSLYKLRARGYNVDRVLRRKAAEARVAELDRQRREEEERKILEEAQRQQFSSASPTELDNNIKEENGRPLVPGAFQDSPDRPRPPQDLAAQPPSNKSKGLFSNLSKRFGFDDRSSQQLRSLLGQNQQTTTQRTDDDPAPPPYSSNDPNAFAVKTTDKTTEIVTSPNQVQQNLLSAITAARSHQGQQLFSRPQTNTVKEVSSYCDERPGQNLNLVTTLTPGLQIFVDCGAGGPADPSTFVAENREGMDVFASVLVEVAGVFGLRKTTVNIFCDTEGPTIAFNSQGTIFANYRYFAQLHMQEFQISGGSKQGRGQTLVYWFVVICHELAHNLVSDHSSDHSFYTEQFVVGFFGPLVEKLLKIPE